MGIRTRNVIRKLAEIKIRLDRGNSIFYWLRNIVIIIAGIKYIVNLNLPTTILLGLFTVALIYFVGWLDLNKIKLMQQEQELTTGKYNPYFKRRLGS